MLIFKIAPSPLWREALSKGEFKGAPIDLQDGYIHFSTASQARETAAKHFRGQEDLLLVAFDAEAMGDSLRWEPSRGGDLFPHLYRSLKTEEALWSAPLPLDANGEHVFPENFVKAEAGEKSNPDQTESV